jgi:hypothetical protein
MHVSSNGLKIFAVSIPILLIMATCSADISANMGVLSPLNAGATGGVHFPTIVKPTSTSGSDFKKPIGVGALIPSIKSPPCYKNVSPPKVL